MPRATVNINETEKYELRTCPGGYVVLRRLSYGEKLYRQSMAAKMRFTSSGKRDFEGEMDLAQEKVALFEFANCVVEHNLEDNNGEPLDFKNVNHVKSIQGIIGEEITKYINDMNNFEEEDGGNS